MRFYFTFMGRQTLLKDSYVLIDAPNEEAARQLMSYSFGDMWGFCYTQKEFDGQIEQFGLKCLSAVVIDEHGNFVKRGLPAMGGFDL